MAQSISLLRNLPRLVLLLATLFLASGAWAEPSLAERYQQLKSGTVAMLPGTTLSLASSEQNGVVSAEVTGILPYPFAKTAPALGQVENWCQFMPLHFNIKACTYEPKKGGDVLTLFSGRKSYQTPEESYTLAYRVEKHEQDDQHLAISLWADSGPAGTQDYRIEVQALQVKEGTLLYVSSSYRPSMTSSLATRAYLATLGRDKIGFTKIEQNGESQPVQGMRGVIERNVMRYLLAIDTFLSTQSLPAATRRETALKHWFKLNDSYPRQLHEMSESEYLSIKRREWQNQLALQQALNKKYHLTEQKPLAVPAK